MDATSISLRTLIEGALTADAILILTLWMSAAIETRLLQRPWGRSVAAQAVRCDAPC
jgi:hypothetical protein